MIFGAIDFVQQLSDGCVKVGGWAVEDDGIVKKPVSGFKILGRPLYEFTRVDRPDVIQAARCGFAVELASVFDLAALFWNEVSLEAEIAELSVPLSFWSEIEGHVKALIEGYLRNRNVDQNTALPMLAPDCTPRPLRSPSVASDTRIEYLPVRMGGQSSDGSIIIGKHGHLFLIGGTNNVSSLYDGRRDPSNEERWIDLINNRHRTLLKREVSFCQMIIPEKQSVLPEFFPTAMKGPTSLLSAISGAMIGRTYYLDCLEILRRCFVDGVDPFLKVDTHLSYYGAEAIIKGLFNHLGVEYDIFPSYFDTEIIHGDIGGQLFDGYVVESTLKPSLSTWPFAANDPLVRLSVVPSLGHGGTVLEWEAKEPLIKKRVLIFGNSMFERGGAPLGLSWWAARIFEASRFVWSSSNVDEQIVEFQPDLVISQTVERFLENVPGS